MSSIDFDLKRPDDFVEIGDEILEKTVIGRFEEVVEKYPNRIAIKNSMHSLQYRELNNAINNLAHQIDHEAGEDTSPIAFLFQDELFAIIAFMAILKSGRPFVGLHPGNSNEQIKLFLEDSTARLLITNTGYKENVHSVLKGQKSVKAFYFDEINTQLIHPNPVRKVTPDGMFAIFYTSGSTGMPKGVMVGHLFQSQGAQHRINKGFISPSDRISLLTSVCYTAAYPNVMGALLSGARLCIFDLKANSAEQALDWIINEELTVLSPPAATFRTLFGLAPQKLVFSKLRFITLGGESITGSDVELYKLHTHKDCMLFYRFASTETGSICDFPVHHNTPAFQGFLPVGYPAANREVLLLDDEGQVVQDGGVGEIVVRSRFLSLGYWRQPALTAQKFYTDPHDPNIRIYRSGDHGRWRTDGALEVLGRTDTQIKIRGYRVQLEAVDMALRNLEGVKDAATIAYESPRGGKRLIAYIVMSNPKLWSVRVFKSDLRKMLSDYMIPQTFIQLEALPRTATGKVARLELPKPSNERPDLETPFAAPRNHMETQVASIWQNILEIDIIGADDNFFELGGDSLMALEMMLEVQKTLSMAVPQAFFKHATVASLAMLLEKNTSTETKEGMFTIESNKKSASPSESRKKKGRRRAPPTSIQLKQLHPQKYALDVFDRLVDKIVARHIVSKSYVEAKKWQVKWSQNKTVRDLLYSRRYTLFSTWVDSLKDCAVDRSSAFQMSLLANMNFGINPFLHGRKKVGRSTVQTYKDSSLPYWRTLGEILDQVPPGQTNEHFPISGLEHLMQAYKQGNGVILLTFHGVPTPGRFFALQRLLGLDEAIPTISYHIPIEQSQYHNKEELMSEATAAALNAEIALFGQRKLQQGKIINIASDTRDIKGRTYKVTLAGRIYEIKGGFAELALNTGAKIIPHFRCPLPDGNIQLNLGPALNHGVGSRHQQVVSLLDEYASFIEHTWTTHPEALRWSKIASHLARPAAKDHP